MKSLVVLEPRTRPVVEQFEIPTPGPDEVLIRVSFAGVNFTDVHARRATFASPQPYSYPYRLGREAMGVIAATGRPRSDLSIGQRVTAYCNSGAGAISEYVVAHRNSVFAVPDDIPDEQAAALPVMGMTAFCTFKYVVRPAADQSILITAAAGGVGTTLVQLARIHKMTPIVAAAGAADRVAHAMQFGATHGVAYGDSSLSEAVSEVTAARGVQYAIDGVGGAVRAEAFESLAPTGMLVDIGNVTRVPGEPVQYDAESLRAHTIGVFCFSLEGLYATSPGLVDRSMQDAFALLRSGQLRMDIADVVDIDHASLAHDRLEGRAVVGKVLVRLDGGDPHP